jgi:hypothetical protein
MNYKNFLFLLFFIVISLQSESQSLDSLLNNKRVYYASDIVNLPPPKIDGKLSDSCWNIGEWQGNFTQQQPNSGAEPSEQTKIKIVYDKLNLYVAVLCYDKNPEDIRDIFNARDAFSGDITGIAFDSYFDKRTAFEFNVTAAGQKIDLKHLGDYQWDYNWNAVWDGKSSVTDSGWIAEMRIPFSQLRYSNPEEQVWGMHIWRWIERRSEEDQWQLIPREAPAMVYLFGELKGIDNIKHSRQVEFLPYGLLSTQYTGENKLIEPLNYDAGIDAKIGIGSDYTLDATVNPDFGQVEADPSVLNLTSFETFYQEKRPFFLEGTEIFDFELGGDIVYYSRRIGSSPVFPGRYKSLMISDIPNHTTILSSAKFTGKSKKGLSVGILNSLTAQEFANATTSDTVNYKIPVTPLTNFFSGRIKNEFKEGETIIGGAFTSVKRFFNDTITSKLLPENVLSGGFDFVHYWKNKTYYIETKAAGSYLNGSEESILRKQLAHNHRFQRPDARHLEVDSTTKALYGHGALFEIGKKGGNWLFTINGQYRNPGLNLNDMGYIRYSDFISQLTEFTYAMNTPGKLFRNYSVNLHQSAGWSFGKENTLNETGVDFNSQFINLWRLNLSYHLIFSVLDTRELWGGPALRNNMNQQFGISCMTNRSKNLSSNAGFTYIKYKNNESYTSGLYMGIRWLPVRKIRLNLNGSYEQRHYNQQYVESVYRTGQTDYITGDIHQKTLSFTLRGEVFITPELSLQYYGNPYFSTGRYDDFKKVMNASSFNRDERFEKVEAVLNPVDNIYTYQIDGENAFFGNPDFTFMQFRSNFVFRWEYKLGSTFYLVWTHSKTLYENAEYSIPSKAGDLFEISGENIFMIKINYWFSI